VGVAAHVETRNSEPTAPRGCVPAARASAACFLGALRFPLAIRLAFKRNDFGVMGQAINQCDSTRGIGKHGVPLLERGSAACASNDR
jgi:hypothetical protein